MPNGRSRPTNRIVFNKNYYGDIIFTENTYFSETNQPPNYYDNYYLNYNIHFNEMKKLKEEKMKKLEKERNDG
mgnify:CR=1 FL=1